MPSPQAGTIGMIVSLVGAVTLMCSFNTPITLTWHTNHWDTEVCGYSIGIVNEGFYLTPSKLTIVTVQHPVIYKDGFENES